MISLNDGVTGNVGGGQGGIVIHLDAYMDMNVTAIHPVVVETFYSNPQMSTS